MGMTMKIPEMHLNPTAIATREQNRGCWCMSGEPKAFEYIVSNKNVLIVSEFSGYIRIPHHALEQVLCELGYIAKELKDIKEALKT